MKLIFHPKTHRSFYQTGHVIISPEITPMIPYSQHTRTITSPKQHVLCYENDLMAIDQKKKTVLVLRRLGAKGSYLTLVRVADRIL